MGAHSLSVDSLTRRETPTGSPTDLVESKISYICAPDSVALTRRTSPDEHQIKGSAREHSGERFWVQLVNELPMH